MRLTAPDGRFTLTSTTSTDPVGAGLPAMRPDQTTSLAVLTGIAGKPAPTGSVQYLEFQEQQGAPMHYPSLNFALGETIDMLRDQVRTFVAAELAPRAAQIDHDNLFPADMWRKFGDMGLLGITVPE